MPQVQKPYMYIIHIYTARPAFSPEAGGPLFLKLQPPLFLLLAELMPIKRKSRAPTLQRHLQHRHKLRAPRSTERHKENRPRPLFFIGNQSAASCGRGPLPPRGYQQRSPCNSLYSFSVLWYNIHMKYMRHNMHNKCCAA